jgi:hypothetical protein
MGKFIAAALVLAVCVAVLPSYWKGPEPSKTDATIAAVDPIPEARQQIEDLTSAAGVPVEGKLEKPMAIHLGSEGELLEQTRRARFAAGAEGLPADESADLKPALNEPAPPAPPKATSPLANAEANKLKLADPELKRLMESAARSQERVVVVELTVEDPESTLDRLQTLLAQNEVAPANFFVNEQAAEENRKRAEADSQAALFVQSTPEQLAGALQGLQQHQPDSQMNALSNLALGDILLRDRQADEAAGKGQTANEAAHSLAQVLAKYESGQAGGEFGGKLAAGAAMRFSVGPIPDDKATREAKSEPQNAPSTAKADFGALQVPGNAGAAQNAQRSWNSFQFVLSTPIDVWRKDAQDRMEAEAEKKPPVAYQARRANAVADQLREPAQLAKPTEIPADPAKEDAGPKPIRTLFIFRAAPQSNK